MSLDMGKDVAESFGLLMFHPSHENAQQQNLAQCANALYCGDLANPAEMNPSAKDLAKALHGNSTTSVLRQWRRPDPAQQDQYKAVAKETHQQPACGKYLYEHMNPLNEMKNMSSNIALGLPDQSDYSQYSSPLSPAQQRPSPYESNFLAGFSSACEQSGLRNKPAVRNAGPEPYDVNYRRFPVQNTPPAAHRNLYPDQNYMANYKSREFEKKFAQGYQPKNVVYDRQNAQDKLSELYMPKIVEQRISPGEAHLYRGYPNQSVCADRRVSAAQNFCGQPKAMMPTEPNDPFGKNAGMDGQIAPKPDSRFVSYNQNYVKGYTKPSCAPLLQQTLLKPQENYTANYPNPLYAKYGSMQRSSPQLHSTDNMQYNQKNHVAYTYGAKLQQNAYLYEISQRNPQLAQSIVQSASNCTYMHQETPYYSDAQVSYLKPNQKSVRSEFNDCFLGEYNAKQEKHPKKADYMHVQNVPDNYNPHYAYRTDVGSQNYYDKNLYVSHYQHNIHPSQEPPRNISPRETFQENMPYSVITPPHLQKFPAQYNSGTYVQRYMPHAADNQAVHSDFFKNSYAQKIPNADYYQQKNFQEMNRAQYQNIQNINSYQATASEKDVNAERQKSTRERLQNIKEFLESWEEDEDGSINLPDLVLSNIIEKKCVEQEKGNFFDVAPDNNAIANRPLYVYEAKDLSSESLNDYLHLEQVDRLPDNIKGYYKPQEIKIDNKSNSMDSSNLKNVIETVSVSENVRKNCNPDEVLNLSVSRKECNMMKENTLKLNQNKDICFKNLSNKNETVNGNCQSSVIVPNIHFERNNANQETHSIDEVDIVLQTNLVLDTLEIKDEDDFDGIPESFQGSDKSNLISNLSFIKQEIFSETETIENIRAELEETSKNIVDQDKDLISVNAVREFAIKTEIFSDTEETDNSSMKNNDIKQTVGSSNNTHNLQQSKDCNKDFNMLSDTVVSNSCCNDCGDGMEVADISLVLATEGTIKHSMCSNGCAMATAIVPLFSNCTKVDDSEPFERKIVINDENEICDVALDGPQGNKNDSQQNSDFNGRETSAGKNKEDHEFVRNLSKKNQENINIQQNEIHGPPSENDLAGNDENFNLIQYHRNESVVNVEYEEQQIESDGSNAEEIQGETNEYPETVEQQESALANEKTLECRQTDILDDSHSGSANNLNKTDVKSDMVEQKQNQESIIDEMLESIEDKNKCVDKQIDSLNKSVWKYQDANLIECQDHELVDGREENREKSICNKCESESEQYEGNCINEITESHETSVLNELGKNDIDDESEESKHAMETTGSILNDELDEMQESNEHLEYINEQFEVSQQPENIAEKTSETEFKCDDVNELNISNEHFKGSEKINNCVTELNLGKTCDKSKDENNLQMEVNDIKVTATEISQTNDFLHDNSSMDLDIIEENVFECNNQFEKEMFEYELNENNNIKETHNLKKIQVENDSAEDNYKSSCDLSFVAMKGNNILDCSSVRVAKEYAKERKEKNLTIENICQEKLHQKYFEDQIVLECISTETKEKIYCELNETKEVAEEIQENIESTKNLVDFDTIKINDVLQCSNRIIEDIKNVQSIECEVKESAENPMETHGFNFNNEPTDIEVKENVTYGADNINKMKTTEDNVKDTVYSANLENERNYENRTLNSEVMEISECLEEHSLCTDVLQIDSCEILEHNPEYIFLEDENWIENEVIVVSTNEERQIKKRSKPLKLKHVDHNKKCDKKLQLNNLKDSNEIICWRDNMNAVTFQTEEVHSLQCMEKNKELIDNTKELFINPVNPYFDRNCAVPIVSQIKFRSANNNTSYSDACTPKKSLDIPIRLGIKPIINLDEISYSINQVLETFPESSVSQMKSFLQDEINDSNVICQKRQKKTHDIIDPNDFFIPDLISVNKMYAQFEEIDISPQKNQTFNNTNETVLEFQLQSRTDKKNDYFDKFELNCPKLENALPQKTGVHFKEFGNRLNKIKPEIVSSNENVEENKSTLVNMTRSADPYAIHQKIDFNLNIKEKEEEKLTVAANLSEFTKKFIEQKTGQNIETFKNTTRLDSKTKGGSNVNPLNNRVESCQEKCERKPLIKINLQDYRKRRLSLTKSPNQEVDLNVELHNECLQTNHDVAKTESSGVNDGRMVNHESSKTSEKEKSCQQNQETSPNLCNSVHNKIVPIIYISEKEKQNIGRNLNLNVLECRNVMKNEKETLHQMNLEQNLNKAQESKSISGNKKDVTLEPLNVDDKLHHQNGNDQVCETLGTLIKIDEKLHLNSKEVKVHKYRVVPIHEKKITAMKNMEIEKNSPNPKEIKIYEYKSVPVNIQLKKVPQIKIVMKTKDATAETDSIKSENGTCTISNITVGNLSKEFVYKRPKRHKKRFRNLYSADDEDEEISLKQSATESNALTFSEPYETSQRNETITEMSGPKSLVSDNKQVNVQSVNVVKLKRKSSDRKHDTKEKKMKLNNSKAVKKPAIDCNKMISPKKYSIAGVNNYYNPAKLKSEIAKLGRIPKVIIRRSGSEYQAISKDFTSNPVWQPVVRVLRDSCVDKLVEQL